MTRTVSETDKIMKDRRRIRPSSRLCMLSAACHVSRNSKKRMAHGRLKNLPNWAHMKLLHCWRNPGSGSGTSLHYVHHVSLKFQPKYSFSVQDTKWIIGGCHVRCLFYLGILRLKKFQPLCILSTYLTCDDELSLN